MGFHKVPQGSVGFHDILMNQGVSTEDNRGLTSYMKERCVTLHIIVDSSENYLMLL
jgi:hypothetical protein